MPPAVNLTQGVIAKLSDGEQGDMEVKPVLQVADLKLVYAVNPTNNSKEWYRLLLSDGIHLLQGMMATQCNGLVRSQKLQKGSVIQLNQFVCNLIQNRRIIIIIELDVILERCDPIGEPEHYPPKTDSNANASSVIAPSAESEARSLKLNQLCFMNRKDTEQTKQIEELKKQNEDLRKEKERLLGVIERIVGKM